jgi:hypothetical protein
MSGNANMDLGTKEANTGKGIKLNPPQTPLCKEYLSLRLNWIQSLGGKREESYGKMILHRATCPVCQARKAEFDELARNAREPDVKDER